jgi:putative tryptophan/tyrosine transport system substrate-binding protein
MKRREFLTFASGAAAASFSGPRAAHTQQSMPIIGFLHSGVAATNARRVAGFRKGLAEAGLVEGRNVAIEFRWAEGKDERLAELAAELIQRKVAVIATLSSTVAAVAARKATWSIPIYFLIADPPDQLGLVQSLNRPGGNATGIVTLAAEVAEKRLALLRELAPKAPGLALLVKPTHPSAKPVTATVQATASKLGVPVEVLEANTESEIEEAYRRLKPGMPLMVGTDPLFFARRAKLIGLAAERGIPSIYDSREFADAGGLMSYGPNHVGLWGQAGGFIARILKGEKPAELPVVQAAIFETVLNLKTAKALNFDVPERVLALADEVIE